MIAELFVEEVDRGVSVVYNNNPHQYNIWVGTRSETKHSNNNTVC